jgi:hypothetical protein
LLESPPLKFEYSDVRYLVVKEDNDLSEFVSIIEQMPGDPEDLKNLMTRLISIESFKNDFG